MGSKIELREQKLTTELVAVKIMKEDALGKRRKWREDREGR